MRSINPANMLEFEQALLDATRKGSITGWTERMAQLADEAGLPIYYINWHGAPHIVAYAIWENMSKHGDKAVERTIEGIRRRLEDVYPDANSTAHTIALEPDQLHELFLAAEGAAWFYENEYSDRFILHAKGMEYADDQEQVEAVRGLIDDVQKSPAWRKLDYLIFCLPV